MKIRPCPQTPEMTRPPPSRSKKSVSPDRSEDELIFSGVKLSLLSRHVLSNC